LVSGSPPAVGDLTKPERAVWDAFARGATVDLGGDDPTAPDAAAGDWGPDQRVRADVLARLLLGAVPAEPGLTPKLVLAGARITGTLDLSGGTVGCELSLARCWLDGTVQATDAKTRSVTLHGCRVPLLDLWGLDVDGSLRLTDCRTGEVGLGSAHIHGRLHLSGATLANPGGRALTGTRLVVDHGMICRGLTADGEVRLLDARVGSAFILNGAKLVNPNGRALDADGLTAEQSVYCAEGFAATGVVRFLRARVHGQLILDGTIDGTLNLDDAQIQSLAMTSASPVPTRLDGLTYGHLTPHEPAPARIRWLRRDPDGYRAQPYEQLAAHYRRLGDDHQARRVLLAKRRVQRATRPVWWRLPGWLLDGLSGYGYAPGRAFGWLAAAWAIGSAYFAADPPDGDGDGRFNAALYALDVLLPTSLLGLEDQFSPQGAGYWLAIGLQALGWALSIAVLPAVTRTLSRA
jgi:hypothetical protein